METNRQTLARDEPESLGITTVKPQYPQYAVLLKREESFANWPEDAVISADKLPECGLVYTGVGDNVRCYYCGGGLKNWEPQDDPWVEHASWYPNCPHVLLVKGQMFIDRVQKDKSLEAEMQTKVNLLHTVAARSCLQMRFSKCNVLKAITKFISKHGNSNFKGEQICEILLEEEAEKSTDVTDSHTNVASASKEVDTQTTEEEYLQQLIEENNRLKQSRLCKICSHDTASIMFLPCGHIIACPRCAPTITKCQICRVTVKECVKAL